MENWIVSVLCIVKFAKKITEYSCKLGTIWSIKKYRNEKIRNGILTWFSSPTCFLVLMTLWIRTCKFSRLILHVLIYWNLLYAFLLIYYEPFQYYELVERSFLLLCERAGSKLKTEEKSLIIHSRCKKTLRDMHQTLLEILSNAGDGAVPVKVVQAFRKLLLPGFISSRFFIRV